MSHLQRLRSLPCLLCLDQTRTEAAHLRMADPVVNKHQALGQKPPDCYALPLCGYHHRLQHKGSERIFWESIGIDPIKIALALYAFSDDYSHCVEIIEGVAARLPSHSNTE